MKTTLRNQAGMTLIEIMIVLAIIGGLVAVLAGNVFDQFGKSKVNTVKIQFGELTKALQQYNLDCGSFPSTDEGLSALAQSSASCKNWGPTPYAKKALITDPWNNEIIYEKNSSTSFTLYSLGADGMEGGEGLDADIRSEDN